MKKLILTAIGLVVGATLVHAQGFIIVQSTAAAIATNNITLYGGGSGGGSATGKTTTGAGQYDYVLLFSTSDITDGPGDAGWTVATQNGGAALALNNYVIAGAISGTGTSGGVAVNMVAGDTYFTELVGWSASLGTWAQVQSLINTSFAGNTTVGFVGNTGVGTMTPFSTAGAGDPTIFPQTYANSSLTLYLAPTPEPTTLALAGLGGLSMLFLRRRKA